jgi:hypothetical protein
MLEKVSAIMSIAFAFSNSANQLLHAIQEIEFGLHGPDARKTLFHRGVLPGFRSADIRLRLTQHRDGILQLTIYEHENDDFGGRGRTRTGTPVTQKQILSLLCLPFHHAAKRERF